MSDVRLIVGLGNPGKEYTYSRHNLGFLVVQELARRCKISFFKSSKLKSYSGQREIDGVKTRLLLPVTYMNNSGQAVKAAVDDGHKIDNILVVVDDFQLPFGQLRVRPSGSDGGHNGLTSVIEHLGTQKFSRLRIGIGTPADKRQVVDYVLSEFTQGEKKQLDGVLEEACQCCVAWLSGTTQTAMNQFNKRKANE